jgi:predicted HTH domain antitoxin
MKTVELDDELVELLEGEEQPLEQITREALVLRLYRQRKISSGKAAQLLGMPRLTFIQHAARQGVPYFDMTKDEWEAEKAAAKSL